MREREWAGNLRTRYGLTTDGYAALLAAQGGCCAICGARETGHSKQRRLHVDHDHATRKVRGLLCVHCNSLLGYARDSVPNLVAAIWYLEKNR